MQRSIKYCCNVTKCSSHPGFFSFFCSALWSYIPLQPQPPKKLARNNELNLKTLVARNSDWAVCELVTPRSRGTSVVHTASLVCSAYKYTDCKASSAQQSKPLVRGVYWHQHAYVPTYVKVRIRTHTDIYPCTGSIRMVPNKRTAGAHAFIGSSTRTELR